MVAKADIRDKVKNRLANIPTAVTDTIIEEYVEDAHVDIENATGDSFATSSIPTKYTAVITDMSVMMVIDYMMDAVVKKSQNIGGDINVNYNEVMQSLRSMKMSLERKVTKALNMIGTVRNFQYTDP